MEIILLDTNSLIYAIQNRINLEEEIKYILPGVKPAVPDCVTVELKGLGKTKWYAKAALQYSERFDHVDSRGEGDFCIMMTARALNAGVLTNDRKFLKILKNKGVSCVTITGRHGLKFY
ncbi:PIN domain-containing protein [Ferroplasma sp.]|uniref:type II toxin-antitoxin system VapC family toxin n=1 Tax=Ferroplasma sp. TaxID=2591003 RepID=UPI00307D70F9